MLHTLVATVENKPGVLNRISSLLRRRNFNIASLTVGETENPAISRMTIVVESHRSKAHIVTENLYKLVNVIEVNELDNVPNVKRDLVLLKVHTDSTTRLEIMQFSTLFSAKMVDVTHDSLMMEMTGSPDEVENFINIMRPFGIIEMVRTGMVAMASGKNHTSSHSQRYRRQG
jgi:acetolactate synthase-1/3 small subunit